MGSGEEDDEAGSFGTGRRGCACRQLVAICAVEDRVENRARRANQLLDDATQWGASTKFSVQQSRHNTEWMVGSQGSQRLMPYPVWWRRAWQSPSQKYCSVGAQTFAAPRKMHHTKGGEYTANDTLARGRNAFAAFDLACSRALDISPQTVQCLDSALAREQHWFLDLDLCR